MKQFCLNVCSVKDTDIKNPRLTKRNKKKIANAFIKLFGFMSKHFEML